MLNVAERSSRSPESAQDGAGQADEYDWLPVGYRVIPDWTCYVLSAELDLWSLPRKVPCKGGAVRQTRAKQVKPSKDGRVTLSQHGKTHRFHVARDLYPRVFPDRLRPRVECRKKHPLVEFEHEVLRRWMTPKPAVSYWGSGNRICLQCCNPPDRYPHDKTYSREYGTLRG